MAVVAGLFDDEVEATKAMDKLLREHIEDMETRVIDGRGNNPGTNVVIPLVPNTGGSGGPGMAGTGAAIAGSAWAGFDWLDDMDDVERRFYSDGVREGSTLALAKVDDEDAEHVRELMRNFGARTYVKD